MIGYLRGVIQNKQASSLVLQASGVGYEVFVPASTLGQMPQENEQAELYVHTEVQDRAIELFGFATLLERNVFRILIAVSGIGPRTALGILSELNVSDLVAAVQFDDHRILEKVPKIGKKTAARLIIELRDKIENFEVPPEMPPSHSVPQAVDIAKDAAQALVELGFTSRESSRAVRAVAEQASTAEQAVRLALARLSSASA